MIVGAAPGAVRVDGYKCERTSRNDDGKEIGIGDRQGSGQRNTRAVGQAYGRACQLDSLSGASAASRVDLLQVVATDGACFAEQEPQYRDRDSDANIRERPGHKCGRCHQRRATTSEKRAEPPVSEPTTVVTCSVLHTQERALELVAERSSIDDQTTMDLLSVGAPTHRVDHRLLPARA